MTWDMVELLDVAPARTSKKPNAPDEIVWNITLDQIESATGQIANKEFASISSAPQSSNFIDETNVLYSKLRPYLNKVIIPDSFGVATTELVPLCPDTTRLYNKYLLYYLRSKKFVDWASNTVAGAKMPRLNMKEFWKHKIPLPPLETQKRIVELLDRAQALIDKRKEQIALMDQLIQSLFYDMFGDPVTNPKGWDVKEIEKILSVKHGFAFKSDFFVDKGDYVVLTPGNFHESGGYRDRKDKQKYYSGEIPDGYILERGQMLVAMPEQALGLLGSPIFVLEADKYLHNQRLGLVLPETNCVNLVFLFHFFNTSYFREKVQFTSTGTKVKHTSPRKIQAVECPLPPIDLQNTFANRVRKIETQKETMTASLSELEDNFNSLMQRAFKGELV